MNKPTQISPNKLYPDPQQPRKILNKEHLKGLEESVVVEGIINPIEVSPDGTGKYKIITGECRWRVGKKLKLKTIPVILNDTPLTYYERLRHQMAENLHQSGSSTDNAMNPMDIAKGYAQLLLLKMQEKEKSQEQFTEEELIAAYHQVDFKVKFIKVRFLAQELGVSMETLKEYLMLLEQPEFVQEAIKKGVKRSYFTWAEYANGELKETIQKKVVKGHYNSGEEIRTDILVSKRFPEIAESELERNRKKESEAVNRLLNNIVKTALALQRVSHNETSPREEKIILKQLAWLQGKIEEYLIVPLETN